MYLKLHIFFLCGFFSLQAQDISGLPEMGMGIFTPMLQSEKALHFYDNPLEVQTIERLKPKDSIVFGLTPHNQFEIKSMPKDFSPEYVKLDYDMLFLKVISMGKSFVEVEFNKNKNTTLFVQAESGSIKSWESFLLNVNSVVFIESFPQKIKSQPMIGSKTIFPEGDYFMVPEHIQGEWMLIAITDRQYNPKDKGWIQWRKDGKLLIGYKMLS